MISFNLTRSEEATITFFSTLVSASFGLSTLVGCSFGTTRVAPFGFFTFDATDTSGVYRHACSTIADKISAVSILSVEPKRWLGFTVRGKPLPSVYKTDA